MFTFLDQDNPKRARVDPKNIIPYKGNEYVCAECNDKTHAILVQPSVHCLQIEYLLRLDQHLPLCQLVRLAPLVQPHAQLLQLEQEVQLIVLVGAAF